jgi:hypothetical protein
VQSLDGVSELDAVRRDTVYVTESLADSDKEAERATVLRETLCEMLGDGDVDDDLEVVLLSVSDCDREDVQVAVVKIVSLAVTDSDAVMECEEEATLDEDADREPDVVL